MREDTATTFSACRSACSSHVKHCRAHSCIGCLMRIKIWTTPNVTTKTTRLAPPAVQIDLCAGVFMFFTLTTFTSVQIDIWDMLTSARDSCTDNEQRRRLNFLRNITPPIWMTFGVCWHLEYFGLISIYNAEMVVLWGNFVSKVHSIHCFPPMLFLAQ